MIFRSIRFKISLWYILVLSLTYSLSSFVLFQVLHRHLQTEVNELLISKASGIQDSIESAWQTEKADVAQGAPPEIALKKRNNLNFEKVVLRWLPEKARDPHLADIDVEIFDARGKLIASAGALAAVAQPGLLEGPQRGARRLEDRSIENLPGRSSRFRVYCSAQMENGQVAYYVQVLFPLASMISSLRQLKIILFFLFPFIFLLSGLAGAFLARVTLNPIARMLDTIRHISAENMRLRVAVPNARDELRQLAETFNGMLDRLERAFTSQQQFIEDLAHEVKTPLAAIKGELEVTLMRLRSSEDYELVLNSSLEEVNRIIGLSENLLMLARCDSDRLTLDRGIVDLGSLVRETAGLMRSLAFQKDVSVSVSVTEPLKVLGDEAKLNRLLLSILDNALKHTPTHGSVNVRAFGDQEWARVEISDTGGGIADSDLPHIFDRFYRGKASERQGGFGLGLTIARSIAEAHQGKIEVASPPSGGTTFTVLLPLCRDEKTLISF